MPLAVMLVPDRHRRRGMACVHAVRNQQHGGHAVPRLDFVEHGFDAIAILANRLPQHGLQSTRLRPRSAQTLQQLGTKILGGHLFPHFLSGGAGTRFRRQDQRGPGGRLHHKIAASHPLGFRRLMNWHRCCSLFFLNPILPPRRVKGQSGSPGPFRSAHDLSSLSFCLSFTKRGSTTKQCKEKESGDKSRALQKRRARRLFIALVEGDRVLDSPTSSAGVKRGLRTLRFECRSPTMVQTSESVFGPSCR